MKRWLAAAILGLGIAGMAHAAIDTYQFANDTDRERFHELTKEPVSYTHLTLPTILLV